MAFLTKPKQDGAPQPGTVKRPASFHGRVPTKPNINFALVGVKRTRWWLVILVLVLILAAAAAVAKFLVIDRFAEVSAAQAEAEAVRLQCEESYHRIAAYGELNDVYAHYTYSGMTEEELARVDRSDVMDLLQRVILPRTEVSDWNLTENRLSISIEGKTLQDINATVQKLLEDELVSYCEVSTATTETGTSRYQRLNPDMVSANVVVYLAKPEEVAEK